MWLHVIMVVLILTAISSAYAEQSFEEGLAECGSLCESEEGCISIQYQMEKKECVIIYQNGNGNGKLEKKSCTFAINDCPDEPPATISTNCDAIKKAHTDAQSGVYEVRLFNTSSCNGVPGVVKHGSCYVNVYCDMDTFGGGWTVFQKRFNGSVDFYETWRAYDQGFGNLNGEFWAGNRLLHHLTSQDSFDLLVELYQRETNCSLYALYSSFAMNSEADKYSINATLLNNGTAMDSLIVHTGRAFSTKDRDNDAWDKACAVSYHGAWWYGACHSSNLNGHYRDGCTSVYADHMCWLSARGYHYSFAGTEMKIRPSASHSYNTPDEKFCHDRSHPPCDISWVISYKPGDNHMYLMNYSKAKEGYHHLFDLHFITDCVAYIEIHDLPSLDAEWDYDTGECEVNLNDLEYHPKESAGDDCSDGKQWFMYDPEWFKLKAFNT